jgi:hypothetical protein
MLLSAAVAAAAIPGLCNTAHSVAGSCGALVTPDNGTTTDANWEIAVPYPTEPSSTPVTDPCVLQKWVPAWVDTPDAAWLADSNPYSEWITPKVESGRGGYYVYRTLIQVPTTATAVTISGKLLSDNEVYQIFVGGPPGTPCAVMAGPPVNPAPGSFHTWFSFTYTAAVVGGTENGLYFVVRNRGVGGIDSSPTPTGLRIQFDQAASHF